MNVVIDLDKIYPKIHPSIWSVVCFVKVNDSFERIIAVLDTSSNKTIIDAGFAQHHNLKKFCKPFVKNVTYIDRSISYTSFTVALTIVDHHKRFQDNIEAHVVQNFTISCYLHDWSAEIRKDNHFKSIQTIKAPYPPLGMLLIGCEHLHCFQILINHKGGKDKPWAHLTPLGWSFLGSKTSNEENKIVFSDTVSKSRTIF